MIRPEDYFETVVVICATIIIIVVASLIYNYSVCELDFSHQYPTTQSLEMNK